MVASWQACAGLRVGVRGGLRDLTRRLVLPELLLALSTLLGILLAIPATTMLAQDSPKFAFRNHLVATASTSSVAKGLTVQLTALHMFSRGTPADVTRRAIWASSDPGVASVSNLPGTKGLVTGVNAGFVTITAVSGPERSSVNITVTGPAIVAITVTPADDSILLPGQDTYSAMATYSDNSTPADVTTQVTWSATPGRIAGMLNNTASGVSAGIATITAKDSNSGVSGSTSLNVGLSSIVVNPSNPSIPLGTAQQFTATGNFSNGSQQPITVQWGASSSPPMVASISPAGVTQSLAMGMATITATSGISGSTTLIVGPPVAKFIAVRPANDNIGVGATLQFSAAQIFTDGSIVPLSGATWTSSIPSVAGIDAAKGSLTAFSAGSTTITATSGSQQQGTATLNVGYTRFAFVSDATDGSVSIYSVGSSGRWRDHGYVFLGANSQPRTPATSPDGRFLYVPLAGAGSIAGFATDAGGNLTAVGSPFPSGTAPSQVVVAPNGQFAYAPNSGSGTISQYSIDGTGTFTGMTTVQAGARPVFLAIDPSGKFLYAADSGSSIVLAYAIDPAAGTLNAPVTVPSGGSSPQSLAIDPTGSFLLVANSGGAGNIASFTINPATGALTPVGASNASGAVGVAIDPVGRYAYSANGSSNTISAFRIDSQTGALTAVGSPISVAGIPISVRVDVSGTQLYVVGSQSNELSTFAIAADGTLTLLRGTRTRGGPYDFATTIGQPLQYIPKFTLLSLSNANMTNSYSVDPASGALNAQPVGSALEGDPRPAGDYSGSVSVAADLSGRFAYVADQAGKQVFGYSITASGGLIALVNPPIAAGSLMEQLAVDASGRFIYAVDCAGNEVWSYALQNSSLASISGAPFSAGSCPFAVTTDPTGRFVYVGNFVDNTVSAFAIDPATGVLTQIGSPVISSGRPTGIAVHPNGKFIYVTNTPGGSPGSVQIFALNAVTGTLTGGGTTFTVGHGPTAVTLDPDGKFLYVVDFGGPDPTKNPAPILPGDITAFAVDESTGALAPINGSPYQVPYSADGISIEPAGKFLYLTVRGDFANHYLDEVLVFSLDPKSGQLQLLPADTMTFTPPGQGPSSIVVTGTIQ